ncbi:hypothetical protein HAX54_023657 [Datura stramonium]|uniref:Uncharacterized protein n=1 Tax=Datura stramonium TaxID=4076 RepID=A0ABS8UZ51_DATST|nr:hypothetical protein [Datura stramonium]
MATACITTMPDQTCQVSCKPHSSLVTWLAFAMPSFSCLELLVSERLCFSSATYTAQSNASKMQNSTSPWFNRMQQGLVFFDVKIVDMLGVVQRIA